jgi:transposase InsO family protein
MPLCAKTIYHPNFIAGYYLNILPPDLLHKIPRSTRHDWNVKQHKNMFGSHWGCNNRQRIETLALINGNETLLAINKTLVKVIAIKKYIAKHIIRIKGGIGNADKIVLTHIKKAATVLGLSTTLSYIQITASFYRALSKPKKCSFSLLNLCRVKHPAQLLQKQVAVIKEYAQNEIYNHWPLSAVYHKILRDAAGFFCKSTFYKYVCLLGIKRIKPVHTNTNHKTGIRATGCLQMLHADITEFKTADNKKAFIYLIIDNYSRTILSWHISHLRKASIAFKNIEKVYKQYLVPNNIEYCSLVTDDGVENYGKVSEFIRDSQYPAIQHLIAHKNIAFSNSMIEYANKRIKYDYLYRQHITDKEELIKKFKGFVADYNTRPNNIFNGLSNNEVLNGQDFKTISFASQIAGAKNERIIQNKKMKCCFSSF